MNEVACTTCCCIRSTLVTVYSSHDWLFAFMCERLCVHLSRERPEGLVPWPAWILIEPLLAGVVLTCVAMQPCYNKKKEKYLAS